MDIYTNSEKSSFSLLWDKDHLIRIEGYKLYLQSEEVIERVVTFLLEQGFQYKEYKGNNGYSLCLEKSDTEFATVSKTVNEHRFNSTNVRESKAGISKSRGDHGWEIG